MRTDTEELKQQIQYVAEKLSLDDFTIEKDIHLTKAIAIISEQSHELYDLIFQGGTSLAKAHRIIERMSEDCDFRIRLKQAGKNISKAQKRKALRDFRHDVIISLRSNGFIVSDDAIRVRNEGQFMSIRAHYPTSYPFVETIKPYLALEFFLAEVKVNPEKKPVTTLIRQVLGDNVSHAEFPVNTVAIIETAAEKWVALTRRVATSKYRQHYRDPNLYPKRFNVRFLASHLHTIFTRNFPKKIVT